MLVIDTYKAHREQDLGCYKFLLAFYKNVTSKLNDAKDYNLVTSNEVMLLQSNI